MNSVFTFRQGFALAALGCLVLLGAAYLLEYGFQVEPCPLCLLQRYVFWMMAFIFGLGALHNCKENVGRYVYCIIALVLSLIGALLAIRHIWLQHLPPEQVPSCTAGLERMLKFQPILKVLQTVLMASGECAKVDFTLLGISLPIWTLFSFLIFLSFTLWIMFLVKKRRIN